MKSSFELNSCDCSVLFKNLFFISFNTFETWNLLYSYFYYDENDHINFKIKEFYENEQFNTFFPKQMTKEVLKELESEFNERKDSLVGGYIQLFLEKYIDNQFIAAFLNAVERKETYLTRNINAYLPSNKDTTLKNDKFNIVERFLNELNSPELYYDNFRADISWDFSNITSKARLSKGNNGGKNPDIYFVYSFYAKEKYTELAHGYNSLNGKSEFDIENEIFTSDKEENEFVELCNGLNNIRQKSLEATNKMWASCISIDQISELMNKDKIQLNPNFLLDFGEHYLYSEIFAFQHVYETRFRENPDFEKDSDLQIKNIKKTLQANSEIRTPTRITYSKLKELSITTHRSYLKHKKEDSLNKNIGDTKKTLLDYIGSVDKNYSMLETNMDFCGVEFKNKHLKLLKSLFFNHDAFVLFMLENLEKAETEDDYISFIKEIYNSDQGRWRKLYSKYTNRKNDSTFPKEKYFGSFMKLICYQEHENKETDSIDKKILERKKNAFLIANELKHIIDESFYENETDFITFLKEKVSIYYEVIKISDGNQKIDCSLYFDFLNEIKECFKLYCDILKVTSFSVDMLYKSRICDIEIKLKNYAKQKGIDYDTK